jgi:ABC-type multidrug transport system permease subunit
MSWNPFDLLRPLFSFLICLLEWGAGLLIALLTGLANLLIAGLMLLLGPLLGLLPNASLASFEVPGYLAWANWLFPLDQFAIALVVVVAVLVVWGVISIGLRWLKVVE